MNNFDFPALLVLHRGWPPKISKQQIGVEENFHFLWPKTNPFFSVVIPCILLNLVRVRITIMVIFYFLISFFSIFQTMKPRLRTGAAIAPTATLSSRALTALLFGLGLVGLAATQGADLFECPRGKHAPNITCCFMPIFFKSTLKVATSKVFCTTTKKTLLSFPRQDRGKTIWKFLQKGNHFQAPVGFNGHDMRCACIEGDQASVTLVCLP